MRYPFYIAARYTISKSKSTAVNIITRIATIGIIVSATALFVILSVFSGLKNFSLSFTNATDPDLKATARLGKSFTVTPQQEQQLSSVKGLASYSKVVEDRVLFYFDEKEQVAFLKGVDSTFTNVTNINKHLAAGNWLQPKTIQAVAGIGIYNKLSLALLDVNRALEVYVPKPGKGAIDAPEEAFNKSPLAVVGVYSINDDADSKYVYCDLPLARELLQLKPGQVTALELKLAPGANEDNVRKDIEGLFKNKVTIKNRAQLNDALYKMLNAENLAVYLFCSLVVVMTLFCLAGALIMLILDKRENIKTLYSLGAQQDSLRNIFLYQGMFITALGAFLGLLLGSAIIYLQQTHELIMIVPGKLAYPVEFNFANVLIVIATIFTLGFIASGIAAGRVNASLLENT
ncbi:ABC transporter permease [Flavobacterium cyanobacteriorum]|uniref:ABC transporter permease n=1 Tax=Flavobacterium cyanobacteriorum TaxID=2022802 RepID=A0A255ZAF4_9FLAO|nr:FtsX-like permease family protein [Flavobacterium cyanobacteriorum]OYQ38436.1 ABC transporter permease [Flavobacterium cyanobacteriorum]